MTTKTVVLERVIPAVVIEALNGMMLAAFTIVLCGLIFYLATEAWHRKGSLRTFVHSQKPVIAVGVIFAGVWLRTFVFWYLRHAENQGMAPPLWRPYAIHLAALGTFAAVVGCLCWHRVSISRRWAYLIWPLAMVVCIVLPIWLSLP